MVGRNMKKSKVGKEKLEGMGWYGRYGIIRSRDRWVVSVKPRLPAVSRLCGPYTLYHKLLNSDTVVQKRQWQYVNEWLWLVSKKNYLQTLKFEFHVIFMCHKLFVCFWFFSNHLKYRHHSWFTGHLKISSGQVWPIGHCLQPYMYSIVRDVFSNEVTLR